MAFYDERRENADKAFEEHDFKAPVVDSDGWDIDGHIWYRRVYFDVGLRDTVVGIFWVRFVHESAKISEVN